MPQSSLTSCLARQQKWEVPREIAREGPTHWEASVGAERLSADYGGTSVNRYPAPEIFFQNVRTVPNSGSKFLTSACRYSATFIDDVGRTQSHNNWNFGFLSN